MHLFIISLPSIELSFLDTSFLGKPKDLSGFILVSITWVALIFDGQVPSFIW